MKEKMALLLPSQKLKYKEQLKQLRLHCLFAALGKAVFVVAGVALGLVVQALMDF